MTSKYEEIQNIYNIIKEYKSVFSGAVDGNTKN